MRDASAADRPSARVLPIFATLCVVMMTTFAQAQTLTIYDDADQNGFNSGYSYGSPLPDIASTTEVHSGTKSVSFVGNDYNALAWGNDASFSTATYPVLHLWIHGGAAGRQHLRLYVSSGGVGNDAVLDPYISGGSIAAGEWREVTVDLTQPPFSLASFDRIDLQSDQAAAQSAIYIDDVVVTQAAPAAFTAMQIDHDVTVASMLSDRFTWKDSSNETRVAVLAHNDTAAGPGGSRGGALREFRYQLPNGDTRTATVTTYGNGGYAGFGYVVSHASRYDSCVGDDSPLGGFIAGTWERVFEGTHHAIFRFRQNYKRNCSTTPGAARTLPVVIDWLFVTGHDHPLWAITYHVDQAGPNAPVNTFYDDSRAPYGELNIDGDGWTNLDGIAWGDKYKFTSTGSPATLGTAWTWNVENTVPYVKEWLNGPLGANNIKDATMGIVQTQTMAQQDAGGARDPDIGSDITPFWNKTSAIVGNACTQPTRTHAFPCANDWPYQAYANSLDYEYPNASNNARLTWKTQFGFIGQSSYALNDGSGGNGSGYPKKSYSTYIVLGTHSSAPVEAQVTQVETVQSVVLTASVGSVVTSGPAGIDRADTVTYDPPGYNHVYGALALNTAANQLDANIAVGNGTLTRPLLIIGEYTAGDPVTVRLDGVPLAADADYFASLRPAASELWLTLNRNLAGAVNHLEIINDAVAGAPANLVASASSISQVHLTWDAVPNADSYDIYRRVSNGAFAPLASTVAPSHDDAGLAADTTYLYKVVAVIGGVASPESNVDAATTTMFTDDPLVAGTTKAKSVHIAQLRTAIGAMRTAANLGAYPFTDGGPGAIAIKAVHLTQLRSALDEARTGLDLPALVYTDAVITAGSTLIKAAHITELRSGVR